MRLTNPIIGTSNHYRTLMQKYKRNNWPFQSLDFIKIKDMKVLRTIFISSYYSLVIQKELFEHILAQFLTKKLPKHSRRVNANFGLSILNLAVFIDCNELKLKPTNFQALSMNFWYFVHWQFYTMFYEITSVCILHFFIISSKSTIQEHL